MAGSEGLPITLLPARMAVLVFLFPHTAPRGEVGSWRRLLGFEAFRLMREKDLRVLLIGSAVRSMPIASFYMDTPEHLLTSVMCARHLP